VLQTISCYLISVSFVATLPDDLNIGDNSARIVHRGQSIR